MSPRRTSRPEVLAAEVLTTTSLLKARLAAVLLLVLGLVAAFGLGAPRDASDRANAAAVQEQEKPEPPTKQEKPPLALQKLQDVFGDPLPPDAVARLGAARLRHGALVLALTFAPDGKTLAAATGDELFRLPGQPGGVSSVAFSPDGKRLAAASAGVIELWDLRSR